MERFRPLLQFDYALRRRAVCAFLEITPGQLSSCSTHFTRRDPDTGRFLSFISATDWLPLWGLAGVRSDEFIMANKMLIDATHPEETRVVVLRGSRVEEFDFESASKRQLRGNIYLAKVIRVEPSLQAAFVDYGGNRHGFLAFSEIHPDYYQIPVSDRQALLEEEAQEEHDEDEEKRPRRSRRRRGDRPAAAAQRNGDDKVSEHAEFDEHADRLLEHDAHDGSGHNAAGELTANAESGDDRSRPVHLDAEQTPPYDDPTAKLIEHAGEMHGSEFPEAGGPFSAHSEAAQIRSNDEPAEPVQQPALIDPPQLPGEQGIAEQTFPSGRREQADADAPSTAEDFEASYSPYTILERGAQAAGETFASDAAPGAHGGAEERDGTAARNRSHDREDSDEHDEEEEHVDQIGGDALEEVPRRAYRPRRQYKIQEVIKRRQVLLVQVVKEERGNKGAALTTFLSLAGRYSVLMPNTARGGGISRKITDSGDRQRLKSIAQELEVPEGMGVILRTAGAMRTKPEVKRDFEYLMRMWETVRETTLASSAPTLVYEEGSLIKRAIRDLYNKDVEEIVVAGEDGYREAKGFMRLLMPSHTKNVQFWRDAAPIFTKAGAEAQLDAMFSNQVTLKSGGYLVINQTEALVAIDVNSGRSTREHNIEDTALRTNLEAADEVARQLRLRDLAGLIVVDFIDMEENRNNRAVEKRIKDALKDDRARIQVGRISHFGLLEMSRQRIRTGVLEGSTEVCHHCAGAGMVRSTASIALHVLRLLEDALISDASRNVTVRTRGHVALYILNHKRANLTDLEGRFGVAITFESDEDLTGTTYCGLERGEPATGTVRPVRQIAFDEPEEDVEPTSDDAASDEAASEVSEASAGNGDESGDARRRRRRRRGRGRDRESSGIAEDAPQPSDDVLGLVGGMDAEASSASQEQPSEGQLVAGEEETAGDEGRGNRRRRSRRGGKRARDTRSPDIEGVAEGESEQGFEGRQELAAASSSDAVSDAALSDLPVAVAEPQSVDAPQPAELAPVPALTAVEVAPETPTSLADALPAATLSQDGDASVRVPRPEPVSSEPDPSRPKRSGWWQRAKATLGG